MPSLRVPPPQIPVVSWLTPNKTDQGLLEFWNTEIAEYVALDIGAPHPNARQYPNFRLGKQTPVQGDEKWTLRIWVTDETNPDWFNWAEKFSGEDNAFPIFIRTYREPRNSYTPRTKGPPLDKIYKLVITDPGSGYTVGTYPKITFKEPVPLPTIEATAHGIVAPDGTITEAVLDFGGEGYKQDVEFTVEDPINGNPTSGIAYIQPRSAILTKEEASLFPEDSPFYAQYLQVVRVYETIPGPTFYETSLDIDGATLTTATTRQLCSNIQTGEVIDSGTWCKTTKKPTDIDVICEEVVACREIPGIPMLSTSIDQNDDITTQSKTMVEASPPFTTVTIVGNVWTKTFQQDIDGTSLVAWKVVQVRDTQNELDSFEVEIPDLIPREFSGDLPVTTTEQTLIGDASLPTLAAGDLMRRQAQLDAFTYRLTIRGRAGLSFPQTVTNQETTEEYGGGILNVTLTLHNIPLVPDEGLLVVSSQVITLGGGLFLRTTKILDDTTWPVLTEYDQDPEVQSLITTTYQVVDATAVVPPSVVNGVITRYKKIDRWRSLQIIETYSLPADYEEQRFMAQTFPSLWDTTTYAYSTACGATGPIRHGFSTMVQARLAISFSTSKETITGLTLIPNTHHLVHDIINAVLNDGAVITYTGTCSGPVFITPSSPTYTTYITTIQNTEQLISGESVLWRAGLYKNTRLYVTML